MATSGQRYGGISLPILGFLTGLPWNPVTEAYAVGLNPERIVVTGGEVTTDFVHGRITIYLNRQGMIQEATMELLAPLPDGIANSAELDGALRALRMRQRITEATRIVIAGGNGS